MPNRIIKESICTSDNLNLLSAEEETFFYRLIVNCDDYGITDARPSILRAKCYPLKIDSIKDKDIERRLEALVRANLIFIYVVDKKHYLKMSSWENHQQIRAKRSKFPLPPESNDAMISDDINPNQMNDDGCICPRNPIQSEYNPNHNPNPNKELEKENVEKLWFSYPKTKGKAEAIKKIPKLIKDYGYEQIERAIERYKKEIALNKTDKQFIQYGSTFFNSGITDYLDDNYTVPVKKNDDWREF